MAYFWLNQRSDGAYKSVEGEVYHYRGNVPGSKKLSEGDRFTYYRPSETVIVGTGVIDTIREEDNRPEGVTSNVFIEYFAEITDYQAFDPVVDVWDVRDRVSFLREKEGLGGIPQHSIFEISEKDFQIMLEAANIGE